MKRLVLLLGCSGALLGGADLADVRTVYVMPMSRGLDQYLANRIANHHIFRIVTDPKLADAVLTDALGENLQAELENIAPLPGSTAPAATASATTAASTPAPAAAAPTTPAAKPPAPPAQPAAAPATTAPATPAPKPATAPATQPAASDAVVETPRKRKVDNPGSVVSMFQDTENRVAPPVSTFGRGKGTIFLIDAKSRQVVWSTFDPPKGTRSHDLDRTASSIVDRLKKDLKPQK